MFLPFEGGDLRSFILSPKKATLRKLQAQPDDQTHDGPREKIVQIAKQKNDEVPTAID